MKTRTRNRICDVLAGTGIAAILSGSYIVPFTMAYARRIQGEDQRIVATQPVHGEEIYTQAKRNTAQMVESSKTAMMYLMGAGTPTFLAGLLFRRREDE